LAGEASLPPRYGTGDRTRRAPLRPVVRLRPRESRPHAGTSERQAARRDDNRRDALYRSVALRCCPIFELSVASDPDRHPLFISIRLAQDGYLGLLTRHSVGNGEPAPQALVNPTPTSRWERTGLGRAGCAAAWSSSTTQARPTPPTSPCGNRATDDSNVPPRKCRGAPLLKTASVPSPEKPDEDRLRLAISEALCDFKKSPATCGSGRGAADIHTIVTRSDGRRRMQATVSAIIFNSRRSKWTGRLT
jgi:hypothetical protein